MHLTQEALLEFHKKMGQTIGDPRKPDVQQEQAFRLRLIREELKELEEALENDDIVKTADGLADLIYVLAGSAVTWGIDLASVFEEVHRSNMTKKRENKRADGKVLKDKDFSPADIKAVLDDAAANYSDDPEDGWWEKPHCAQRDTVPVCDKCGRRKSKSAGCDDGSCNKGPYVEPPEHISQNIMMAAKDQAKILAMKDIKADFAPGLRSNGVTESGVPYTVNDTAWKDYQELSQEQSNGVPQVIKGEMTTWGAYVIECVGEGCGRRHAVHSQMGSRGGLAKSGSCECICGKAYTVDFTTKDPTVTLTTIEDLRKVK